MLLILRQCNRLSLSAFSSATAAASATAMNSQRLLAPMSREPRAHPMQPIARQAIHSASCDRSSLHSVASVASATLQGASRDYGLSPNRVGWSGSPRALHLRAFNALTKKVDPILTPDHDAGNNNNNTNDATKTLSWYICGPTVYDDAHLGHARWRRGRVVCFASRVCNRLST